MRDKGHVAYSSPTGFRILPNDSFYDFTINSTCRTKTGTLLITFTRQSGSKTYIEILDEGEFHVWDNGVLYFYGPNFKSYDGGGVQTFYDGRGYTDTSNQTNIGSDYASIKNNGSSYYTLKFLNKRERELVLNANGGAWSGGATTDKQIIDTSYKPVTDDRPTRDGYVLDSWNTKADGTGDDASVLKTGLKDGQTLYAIWKKDPGKPRNVQIDCSPRKAGGVLCSVMAYYGSNAPVQTRELTTSGTNQLAWAGDPITGVNLDRNGYAADMSCTTRGDGDSQCYYASLASAPADSNTTVVTQTPTTGAPASDAVWPAVAVLAVIGLVGVGVMRRRGR